LIENSREDFPQLTSTDLAESQHIGFRILFFTNRCISSENDTDPAKAPKL
jgi:hypothetical protein